MNKRHFIVTAILFSSHLMGVVAPVKDCCKRLESELNEIEKQIHKIRSTDCKIYKNTKKILNNTNTIIDLDQTILNNTNTIINSLSQEVDCGSKVNIILQKDIPLTITTPGRWCLGQDVTSLGDAAITIFGTTEVDIDLNGYTIDGQNQGLSGVIVQNSSLVKVANGTIANMRMPNASEVRPTVTTPSALSLAAALATSTSLAQANAIFLAIPLANPLPLNPLHFSGIALNNVDTVIIENMTIKNCFIGIEGTNQLNNIIIDNCHGNEYGFNFGPSFGASPTRGGFVIFYNDAQGLINSVYITNSSGNSSNAQFGLGIFNETNLFFSNCQMSAGPSIGLVSITGNSAYCVRNCNNCLIQDCMAYAGQDGFTLIGSQNGFVRNCKAMNYSDEGIVGDFTSKFVITDCEAGPSLPNPTSDPIYNTIYNALFGIGLICATDAVVQNCICHDNAFNPLLQPFASGIAVFGNNCIIQNNVTYNNNIGIFVNSSQNCVFTNNVTNNNLLIGFNQVVTLTPLIPNLNNQFTFNQSFNTAVPVDNYVGVPNVVSVAANGLLPVAPYANLMN